MHVDEILYMVLPSITNFHENLIMHVLKNVDVASKLFDYYCTRGLGCYNYTLSYAGIEYK